MKLWSNDIATLERAADLEQRFQAGIFPTGGGSHSHFAKLERMGLLAFDNYGRDIDGEIERDVRVYRLTDSGRAVLAGREASTPKATP